MADSNDLLGAAPINVFVPVLAHRFTASGSRRWLRRKGVS